ncbi:hypothetical protein FJ208_02620 [Candidatus Gribaldobacteria bacterium]|nr:hypothetical protein [Candidatus Gribaldobacteria bacterium]
MSIQEQKVASPFVQAVVVREQMVEAITLGYPFEVVIPPNIFACLWTMPKDVLERHGLSVLIHTKEDGVHVLSADSEEIALVAFQN